jgi:hypothetical protein
MHTFDIVMPPAVWMHLDQNPQSADPSRSSLKASGNPPSSQ